MKIERANPVWAMDMTYSLMARDFVYLSLVMDWASRKVPAWRLSNTMPSDAPVAALEEAIARYDAPQIINTDQGRQFDRSSFFTGISNVVQGRKCTLAAAACTDTGNQPASRRHRTLCRRSLFLGPLLAKP